MAKAKAEFKVEPLLLGSALAMAVAPELLAKIKAEGKRRGLEPGDLADGIVKCGAKLIYSIAAQLPLAHRQELLAKVMSGIAEDALINHGELGEATVRRMSQGRTPGNA